MHAWLDSRHGSGRAGGRERWVVVMVLSEHELRILRSLEDSLQECEQRCTAMERWVAGRRRRLWLIILCLAGLIVGVDLIVLGVMVGAPALVLLGSVALAGTGAGGGKLLYRYLRERASWADGR